MFGKHLKSPDADKVKELRKWNGRDKERQILVHTVSNNYLRSELLARPAEQVFKTWDIISTSLIDFQVVAKKFREISLTVHAASGLFFEAGFILEAPVQNILGTFNGDIWFPNHAGVNRHNMTTTNRFALADNIFAGRDKKGNIRIPGGYNQIQGPDKILRKTNYRWHNEVLLIGRPNINTYQGLPPTRDIRVIGIIVAPKVTYAGNRRTHLEKNKELYELVEMMKANNPDTPVNDLSYQKIQAR